MASLSSLGALPKDRVHNGEALLMAPLTMRLGNLTKVLVKHVPKYYTTSSCPFSEGAQHGADVAMFGTHIPGRACDGYCGKHCKGPKEFAQGKLGQIKASKADIAVLRVYHEGEQRSQRLCKCIS